MTPCLASSFPRLPDSLFSLYFLFIQFLGYNLLFAEEPGSLNGSYAPLAQLVEHAAVNRRVVGSSPTGGAR